MHILNKPIFDTKHALYYIVCIWYRNIVCTRVYLVSKYSVDYLLVCIHLYGVALISRILKT